MNETETFKKLNNNKQNNFPSWIIIHHSGGGENNPFLKTSHHTAQSVEKYHLSKGWDGIGYHYFIHQDGAIWKGRPEHINGAHCKEQSMNTNSIGICLAGNFDIETPTQEQLNSVKSLISEIVVKYNITEDKLTGHRTFAKYKSCPGNKFSDSLIKSLYPKNTEQKCKCLKDATLKELVEELTKKI